MADKAKPCKCKATECEECPEWIFTFADLVMLMMGFFVILWVLKPNPTNPGSNSAAAATKDDYIVKIEASIRAGFGYQPDPESHDPVDQQMIINGASKTKPPGQGKTGHTENTPAGSVGSEPEVTNIRPSRHATQGGKMLFDKGASILSSDMKEQLDTVGQFFRGHRNIVMVKGHTSLDDFGDDATSLVKMDLSLRRAQAAADYLVQKGVDPEIIRVQGCSTYEPLSQQQYSPDAQALNRRVEVEATNTLVDDLKPNKSPVNDESTPSVDTGNAAAPTDTPATGPK
jgi:outer membrane protein OmpA-like peptidoglycan-associated protein